VKWGFFDDQHNYISRPSSGHTCSTLQTAGASSLTTNENEFRQTSDVRKTDSCNTYTISRTWSCSTDINRKWRKHRTQGRTLHFNTQNPDNSHIATLISHKQSSQQHCCWGGSGYIVGICSCRPVYRNVLLQKDHFNNSKYRARRKQFFNSKVLFLK
jgi:hypothetical protein